MTTFTVTPLPRVYCLDAKLLAANSRAFYLLVRDCIHEGHRRFVVDFRGCPRMESAGLGYLVSAQQRVREAGGSLVLEGLSEDMRTLFALTKLDQRFTIHAGVG